MSETGLNALERSSPHWSSWDPTVTGGDAYTPNLAINPGCRRG
jgi:hypothetical protein